MLREIYHPKNIRPWKSRLKHGKCSDDLKQGQNITTGPVLMPLGYPDGFFVQGRIDISGLESTQGADERLS